MFYGVYRCKQCGAVLNAENELDGIFEDGLKFAFINENPIISISPYKSSGKAIAHRCNDSTIGMCELIGWRKIK